jgi:8-oxo-dGTP pyrophosphatase MutT (NUDIX family)/GNAT superfamily N-acetyltransferase
MPIPEYVAGLRAAVGADLLFLTGVTAVVLNDDGEVLLGRRSDNGQWALVSGILEPGEQPASALLREVSEETAVEARVEGLSSVWVMPPMAYPNGDRAEYLDLCFRCRHVSGEPRVNDDESLEVGWFHPSALPLGLSSTSRRKLELALAFSGTTWFEGSPRAVRDGSLAQVYAGGPVSLRRARREDLAGIVGLIADDQLGATREDTGDLMAYLSAFDRIDADPAQLLVVADDGGAVVGTLQLSLIPGLARRGALRGQIEAVRVAESHRGEGLGQAMVTWAVEEARARGCALVQLTTDKSRVDAHRFYERLGFVASHEGMKLVLSSLPGVGAHYPP